jgi:hypothetical protein
LKGSHYGEDKRPAAQLEPQVFKEIVVGVTRYHIVYGTHCMSHSISCQALFMFFQAASIPKVLGAVYEAREVRR